MPAWTHERLVKAMQDKRYWDRDHPGHKAYVEHIAGGFAALYPDPEDDASDRSDFVRAAPDAADPGKKPVQLAEHTLSTNPLNPWPGEDRTPRGEKKWHGQPEEKFRRYISWAEVSIGHKDDGYLQKNSFKTGNAKFPIAYALGRYQLTTGPGGGLTDAGWMTADGTWTAYARANGVTSDDEFLKNPEAQEKAMTDVMGRNEAQAVGKRLLKNLGKVYIGQEGSQITVTPAGLAAAMHRHGAGATNLYFTRLTRSQAAQEPRKLQMWEQEIEQRLRQGQDVEYGGFTPEFRAAGRR